MKTIYFGQVENASISQSQKQVESSIRNCLVLFYRLKLITTYNLYYTEESIGRLGHNLDCKEILNKIIQEGFVEERGLLIGRAGIPSPEEDRLEDPDTKIVHSMSLDQRVQLISRALVYDNRFKIYKIE